MRHISTFRRSLALFVLAFLCLNVGGALCLTYCVGVTHARSSSTADPGLSDHCRHPGKIVAETEQDPSANARSVSCCLLPIALFVAPIEKRNNFSAVAIETTRAIDVKFVPPVLISSHELQSLVYRPPPFDRRIDRIFNGVIRI